MVTKEFGGSLGKEHVTLNCASFYGLFFVEHGRINARIKHEKKKVRALQHGPLAFLVFHKASHRTTLPPLLHHSVIIAAGFLLSESHLQHPSTWEIALCNYDCRCCSKIPIKMQPGRRKVCVSGQSCGDKQKVAHDRNCCLNLLSERKYAELRLTPKVRILVRQSKRVNFKSEAVNP